MATAPKPGDIWIDSRPMTDRREWRDATKFRRCVTVTGASDRYVEGSSFWQERKRGQWVDMPYPPSRSTRILADVFAHRFKPAEDC